MSRWTFRVHNYTCAHCGKKRTQRGVGTRAKYCNAECRKSFYGRMGAAEFSAKMRAMRAQHKSEGLCSSCSDDAAPGRTLCERHLKYHRDVKRAIRGERTARNQCHWCEAPVIPGSNLCDAHRLRQIAACAKRRAKSLRSGMCIRGRACGEPAVRHVLCQEHFDESMAESAYRRAAHQDGAKACGTCSMLGHNHGSCAYMSQEIKVEIHELMVQCHGTTLNSDVVGG